MPTLADLTSVVQLGVATHAGVALLQFATEVASRPLDLKLRRIGSTVRERAQTRPDLAGELEQLEAAEGELKVRQAQFANEYRKFCIFNVSWAFVLAALLSAIALLGSVQITNSVAILIMMLSLLPAPLSMIGLIYGFRHATRSISDNLDAIASRINKRNDVKK
jgi:hypothetical protein